MEKLDYYPFKNINFTKKNKIKNVFKGCVFVCFFLQIKKLIFIIYSIVSKCFNRF